MLSVEDLQDLEQNREYTARDLSDIFNIPIEETKKSLTFLVDHGHIMRYVIDRKTVYIVQQKTAADEILEKLRFLKCTFRDLQESCCIRVPTLRIVLDHLVATNKVRLIRRGHAAIQYELIKNNELGDLPAPKTVRPFTAMVGYSSMLRARENVALICRRDV